jgi:RNA polymerase sigma-32 factor
MQQARDPALSRYIGMANRIPLLTSDEEILLARRWFAQHDRAAAARLVRPHLRYVVGCALRYRRYGVPLNELIAEGNFGLAHALTKYDPDRGVRFVTYAAYWVRAYMLDYIIRCWSIVGGGAGPLRSKLFFRLRREHARVTNLVGEGERADELLGQRLGMKSTKAGDMLRRLESRDVSLDSQLHAGSPRTWLEKLPSDEEDQETSLGDREIGREVRKAVHAALVGLDPRERYVVEARLMADDDEELSLAEIGRRLGVSRERARQLESRAKRKLRTAIARISPESTNQWLGGVAA